MLLKLKNPKLCKIFRKKVNNKQHQIRSNKKIQNLTKKHQLRLKKRLHLADFILLFLLLWDYLAEESRLTLVNPHQRCTTLKRKTDG